MSKLPLDFKELQKDNRIRIEYDENGLLKYNPEFHPNYKKPYTLEDLEYLCKYYEVDGLKSISLALGKPPQAIRSMISRLKKSGKFDFYKNLNRYW